MAAHFTAIARKKAGKNAARQTRHQGLFPAIIYGAAGKNADSQPVKIALDPRPIWKQMQEGRLYSAVYQVDIEGGKSEKIIVRDIQFHPVSDEIIHADFFRVNDETDIVMEVPMHFLNQDKCQGLKKGGVLNVVRYRVPIKCKPQYIPEYLELDLSDFKMGESIHISHVSLPENLSIPIERDFTIATIATPRGMSADEAADADEEESDEQQEES